MDKQLGVVATLLTTRDRPALRRTALEHGDTNGSGTQPTRRPRNDERMCGVHLRESLPGQGWGPVRGRSQAYGILSPALLTSPETLA